VTSLLHASGIVHHCSRRLDLYRGFRVLELHALEVRNRLPKLDAVGKLNRALGRR
jgi:hypothetical protein